MQLPLVQRTDQDGDARMETCYGSSTSYLMTMLPPGVLHMSAVGCFGRFTFSHLAFHIPTLAGSCLCLFCVVVCLVVLFLCFWFLFCKCLGIPNSPRSLDLDDRQGLIARSAMQQKKKMCCCLVLLLWCVSVSCFCFVVFLVPVLQVSRNPEFSAQFRPR